jgi:hypothetical protein
MFCCSVASADTQLQTNLCALHETIVPSHSLEAYHQGPRQLSSTSTGQRDDMSSRLVRPLPSRVSTYHPTTPTLRNRSVDRMPPTHTPPSFPRTTTNHNFPGALVYSHEYTGLLGRGLTPVDQRRQSSLNITAATLSITPYRSITKAILFMGGRWGHAMSNILALGIYLESMDDWPVSGLSIDFHPRPPQISIFLDRQRQFHPDVFRDMDPAIYLSQLWAWWKELQPAMRRGSLVVSPDSPNAVPANLDLTLLRVRGPKGFCLIIIGLMIGRIHLEALPSATYIEYVEWCKLALDVMNVLEAMLGFSATSMGSVLQVKRAHQPRNSFCISNKKCKAE